MANNVGQEKLHFVTSPCHEYYRRNFRHNKQILIHAATKTKKISLVTPHSLLITHQRFGQSSRFHLQLPLNEDAVRFSLTVINAYQTTRNHMQYLVPVARTPNITDDSPGI